MDSKGKKVWFFRVIPLVYASNDVDWRVDIKTPYLNVMADWVVNRLLSCCAAASIPVILTPRVAKQMVKKQPTQAPRRDTQLIEF